jgi:hypothetical protein
MKAHFKEWGFLYILVIVFLVIMIVPAVRNGNRAIADCATFGDDLGYKVRFRDVCEIKTDDLGWMEKDTYLKMLGERELRQSKGEEE